MVAAEDRETEDVAVAPNKEELQAPKPSSRQAGDEIGNNSNYQAYPEALASYQDVVESKKLFMESLEKLHRAMGTKFMIPTIGGKELDLHQLFMEVTSRGGIEKVIGDRRWREITNAFNFPSSATNASFVLRKYYISLLRHFEQVYFFRAKGWSIPSSVSLSTTQASIFQPDIQSAKRKRRKSSGEIALAGQALPENRTVVGVINGKFDDGYFITVTVGTNKLKGILFNATPQNAVEVPVFSGMNANSSPMVSHRRRRRKRISSRDPSHPKPNRSGYNFFFSEQHAKLKLIHQGKDREISRMIGDLWNNLTEAERAVYQEIGLKDKQRYQSELAEYKEKQREGQVLTHVMPIQQLPADPRSIELENMNLKEADDANNKLFEDGVDTIEEKSDEDSEMQISSEAGAAAVESDMERRSEIDAEMASKSDAPVSGNDLEFAETSSDKQ
ncbi:high mobility group B protein 15-like [Phalaenopsis equestris]|uniref:high mobility group B protein 15-like n=1 Tax=Phalaenopsis equestris TaxID=78828 RepID=UPI0009E418EE|nr:high mobility group B protein 15-like [Phalaenopsis equestris]XP_020577919.1 high mobility group B protein 15-like [Phalaenopsis equestris]XP_020577920.1 high mobility group B protein 15-like [Phalaenopsis equestris]